MLSGRRNHHLGRICTTARLLAILVLGGLTAFGSSTSLAQWKTTAGIGLSGTLSDNVGLSGSDKQTEFYTSVSPRISTTYDGPRLKFTGTYSPTAIIYPSKSDADSWFNSLSAVGTLTAIDNFFYVDANIAISQQYLSGFSPIPIDLGNITGNRVETRSYGLSPYIKGTTGWGVNYEVRNRSTYVETDTSDVPNSRFLEWLATADKTIGAYSIGADYDRSQTSYVAQGDLITEVARLRLGYQINPELRLTIRGGYETNNYSSFGNQSGVIYGAGLDATPTPRTSVSGYWEHRFFGNSYSLSASHRRRLTAFTLSGSRQLSTYPQALLSLPPGNTAALLDAALTARIPDPVQRQIFVNQFIQQVGLPPFLLNPFIFNTNTVSLVNQVNASIALLGVRNSIVFSAFRASSENIGQPGGTLPPTLSLNSNFTSHGAAADYTYKLSPKSTLDVLLSRTYTKANDQTNTDTTQDLLRVMVSSQLGVKTTGSLGARYQHILSTVVPGAVEHAIFATLDHTF